jgi:CRP/FNR family cyclic AMP-dependent transcriptional regulator
MSYAEDKIWYLENLNLMKTLPKPALQEVAQQTLMCHFYKDEFIYFSDDPSDTLYFLKEGKVKIANFSDEGKEVIKTILQPGEVFGEFSLLNEDRRTDFAQALDKVKVCKMSKANFQALMERYGNFSIGVNKLIGLRLKKIERRLESLFFKDARARVVEFLLDMAEEQGEKVGFETMIKNHLTHQDIANLTATSRQTVTSVLNDLRSRNLINFNRKQILIRDVDTLKREEVPA